MEATLHGSARSWSPKAEIIMRVEDIWDSLDGQQRQLSHDDKLNSCFDSIPVASFPHAFDGAQLVEIPSDTTFAEAVDFLSRNRIISAPVRNVDAPEDASWIDGDIGIVEFPGIAVWLLHQSEAAAMAGEVGADELAAKLGTVALEKWRVRSAGVQVGGGVHWFEEWGTKTLALRDRPAHHEAQQDRQGTLGVQRTAGSKKFSRIRNSIYLPFSFYVGFGYYLET